MPAALRNSSNRNSYEQLLAMIEVCNISKSYGKVKALDGVSLTVGEGELFGIIGAPAKTCVSVYYLLL